MRQLRCGDLDSFGCGGRDVIKRVDLFIRSPYFTWGVGVVEQNLENWIVSGMGGATAVKQHDAARQSRHSRAGRPPTQPFVFTTSLRRILDEDGKPRRRS